MNHRNNNHRSAPLPSSRTRRPATSENEHPQNSVAKEINNAFEDTFLRLEDEIDFTELNNFSASVTRPLSLAEPISKDHILAAVATKLKSYVALKNELAASIQTQSEHKVITKKLVKTTQAFLDNPAIPQTDKDELLATTVSAVEENLQLKHRIKNLANRIEFLDEAIPAYLVSYATTRGNSKAAINQMAEKTKTVLEQY